MLVIENPDKRNGVKYLLDEPTLRNLDKSYFMSPFYLPRGIYRSKMYRFRDKLKQTLKAILEIISLC